MFIPLTQGQNAIVDAEDFDRLSAFKWFAVWNTHTKSFYAISAGKRIKGGRAKVIRMHQQILECGPGEQIDHRSHDTLDNRKENLRKCTHQQNCYNHRIKKNNTTGFKGVCFHKAAGKWVAGIVVNRKRIHLGIFSSKKDAADAYDDAAKIYHGEFAYLNAAP
jgi:hypothetical protein